MTGIRLAIAIILALAAGPATAGDAVCRPNSLGAVICANSSDRPRPRPIYRKPVQALDRVRARPAATDPGPGFVPARQSDRLGGTPTGARVGAGRCRPDTLGNLRCP